MTEDDNDLRAVRKAMNKDMEKQIVARVHVVTKTQFEMCCTHKKTNMNAVINKAIEAYIKRHYQDAVEYVANASKVATTNK